MLFITLESTPSEKIRIGGIFMSKYYVNFKYSRDGKTWFSSSVTVMAETQSDAMVMVQSKYPYVQIDRITKR